MLRPYLSEDTDRAWVARCIAETGPAHHRGTNFVLLGLLDDLVEQLPAVEAAKVANKMAEVAPVPLRTPPHLRPAKEDDAYPLGIPREALAPLVGPGADRDAMVACLTDGPPQHALANALMLHLLDELRRRIAALR